MRKKLIAGAAVLALLMSAPQVKAEDDIVVFGGEFEDETPPPKQIEKPEPVKELPPEEPAPVEPPVEVPEVPPSEPPEEPEIDKPPLQPVEQPDEPAQVTEPFTDDDDDWGDDLVFDNLELGIRNEELQEPEEPAVDEPPIEPVDESDEPAQIEPPVEIERPFQRPTEPEPVVTVPPPPTFNLPSQPVIVEEPARVPSEPVTPEPVKPAPQKKLKVLKPRFIKLAVDDTYIYYLDKNSVQWKKMPYSSSEYMADVWIRMIEREASPLSEDMAAYGEDNFNAEVALAEEQGYQYAPEDLQVLSAQAYVLEHYYLRPKTNQIQFLCELEVFGRPQNTINERAYDYKNWENLVPGSVESIIYATVLKTIGKSKATERGHMTFIDMLEEYGRISLR